MRCCGGKRKRRPIVRMLSVAGPDRERVMNPDDNHKHMVPKWEPSFVAVDMSTNTDWCHREGVVYANQRKVETSTNTDVPPAYTGGAL